MNFSVKSKVAQFSPSTCHHLTRVSWKFHKTTGLNIYFEASFGLAHHGLISFFGFLWTFSTFPSTKLRNFKLFSFLPLQESFVRSSNFVAIGSSSSSSFPSLLFFCFNSWSQYFYYYKSIRLFYMSLLLKFSKSSQTIAVCGVYFVL